MVYNPNIPQANDLISNSQSQILANFSAIDSSLLGFARDHYSLTDATNGGAHKQVFFPAAASPVPTTTGTQCAIYSGLVSGSYELFFKNANGSTQVTAGTDAFWKSGSGNGIVTESVAQNGFMNLPNGIQFRWGRATGLSDGSSVSFTPAFTTSCFSIQVTGERSNNSVRSLWVNSAPSNASFSVRTDVSGISIWYFAVGN